MDPVAPDISKTIVHSESPTNASPPAQPTEGPQDGDTGGDGDTDEDDEAKKGIKKVGEAISGFWDWFTGKVDKWWGKVKGEAPSKAEPEPGSEPPR